MSDMSSPSDFDLAVLDLARSIFSRVRDDFKCRGMRIQDPELRTWKETSAEYTSELTSAIYKDSQIIDVIEFLIHHNGAAVATMQEIEEWLNDVIASILTEADESL